MKSKKSFLSLGIIVLVLFLGVGYAVVSSVYLNIGGTASVNDHDLNVEITNAVASTNVSGKTVNFTHQLSNKNLTSDFILNEMQLGEIVTITYTVTNNEKDVDAQLALADGVSLRNSNEDYFNVDYQITDNITDLKNNDKTMEVLVTVELIKTPVAEANSSTNVELTLTASPKGGNSGSGSGTEIEATEIYYNQPYNAIVSTEAVASDTATYAKNGQAYNATNLYSNISELQVNARTLADTDNEIIKSIVIYDDHSIELFVDGLISKTFPSSSVFIEGQKLSVDQEFDAEISSDFTTITIGDEVYVLNVSTSPLKIGDNHLYYLGKVDDTPGQLMSVSVVFKSNTHFDAYFNGYLVGESSNKYYTVGNAIYMDDESGSSLYGYVSLDGTQIVSKGYGIYHYQGKDEVFYGRAYTWFADFTGDGKNDRTSFIPYRDGSFDVIIDYGLVQTYPAGSMVIEGNVARFNMGTETYELAIENDGYAFSIYIEIDGVFAKYGLVLDDIWARPIVDGKKFTLIDEDGDSDIIEFENGSFAFYGQTYDYIISDNAIILANKPFVFLYDETTNQYTSYQKNKDGSINELKLIPIE